MREKERKKESEREKARISPEWKLNRGSLFTVKDKISKMEMVIEPGLKLFSLSASLCMCVCVFFFCFIIILYFS